MSQETGNIFSPGLAPLPARPQGLRPEVAQLGPLAEVGAGQRWQYTCAACEIPERFVGYERDKARALVLPKHSRCLIELLVDPLDPGEWMVVRATATPAMAPTATATAPASPPPAAPQEPPAAAPAATATAPTLGAPEGSTGSLFADERVWSAYQQAIFDDAAQGKGNTTVLARAGTGKTTTLVEAVRRMPAGLRVLVLAFNKTIQLELERRMPEGVEVRTLHSLGAQALRDAFAKKSLFVGGKLRAILGREDFFPAVDQAERRSATAKLVGFARATLLDPTTEAAQLCRRSGVDPMVFHDQADLDDPDTDALTHALRRAGRTVAAVLEVCRAEAASHHDFDDMLWLPHVLGLSLGTWDRVVVDEAQDLSSVQIALLLRTVAPGGRVLVVGDDRQAIYGFRGANAQAFAQLTQRLAAKVLPLTITYRCPRKVVDLARQEVPDFEAGPGAPEGIVRESKGLDARDLHPGDFVLSRTNAPLLSLFFRLVAAGVPAVVQGREGFLDELIGMVSDAVRLGDGADEVRERLFARLDRTIEARARRGDDLGDLVDQRACLGTLFERHGSPAAIVEQLRRLAKVDEGKALKAVCLSSVHRAKGLERERVYVLTATFQRGRSQDEANLWYVAITRAKRELVLVAGERG